MPVECQGAALRGDIGARNDKMGSISTDTVIKTQHRWDEVIEWHGHICTTKCKMDSWWEAAT